MRFLCLFAFAGLGLAAFAQTFDVASIRSSAPLTPQTISNAASLRLGMSGGPGSDDPTHLTWNYASLRQIVMQAYDIKTFQLTGPAWFDSERFDFAVTVPEGATKEQVKVMWQNLLTERFALKLRKESKESQVDELVVARGGHKLKESAVDPNQKMSGPPKFEGGDVKLNGAGLVTSMQIRNGVPTAQVNAVAQQVSALLNLLSNEQKRPVIDKTGLTGYYDFRVEFTPELAGLTLNGGAAADPGMNLSAAVQQQLGLRLEKGKGMVDTYTVESGNQKPTEN